VEKGEAQETGNFISGGDVEDNRGLTSRTVKGGSSRESDVESRVAGKARMTNWKRGLLRDSMGKGERGGFLEEKLGVMSHRDKLVRARGLQKRQGAQLNKAGTGGKKSSGGAMVGRIAG